MKLCKDCRSNPWPYAILLFLSVMVAVLTWLTLSTAGLPTHAIRAGSGLAFLGMALVLLVYMVNCMRRHCGDHHHAQ